jgi:N-methylhydantoinase B
MDGMHNTPQGVQGGDAALGSEAFLIRRDGSSEPLREVVGAQTLEVGERMLSLSDGGGGYGDPFTRRTDRVLADVAEGFVSLARARDAYGVVLRGDPACPETLTLDEEATAELREARFA